MASRLNLTIVLATQLIAGLNAQQLSEYHVKAAFLYNFAKFVEWPPTAFHKPDTPFEICVLGLNPFGSTLEEAVQGMQVSGRSFVILKISDVAQAAGCHILFISSSERRQLRAVLDQLKGLNILTVGETEDFLASGGVIRFKLKNEQLRFEINPDAAARERLKISSKLLSLGDARK
jgi:hypothetical protein